MSATRQRTDKKYQSEQGKDIFVRLRGLLYLMLTSCFFGLGTVLAKLSGTTFQPFFISWIAMFGGGVCVAVCQLMMRKPLIPRMPRSAWADMLLFGSVGSALPLVMIVVGLSQTDAITGSFLLQMQTPAALIFAMILLKERISWKQVIGMVLLLVGSLLVILRDSTGSVQFKGGWGDLLVLGAAIIIGFSYIPSKRLTAHGDALQINVLRLFTGAATLLPLLIFQPQILVGQFSWSQLGILAIYVVANFGAGYILLQSGISLLRSWEASAILQTMPLFSTFLAVLLLHETLTPLQMIGGCVVLAGGLLVVLAPPKGEPVKEKEAVRALPTVD
jgi:drug/metabolite transporter (DMT)-like permease